MPEARQMPKYKHSQEVRAMKIASVTYNSDPDSKDIFLGFDDGYDSVRVPASWGRFLETDGDGYYVVYEDGYALFSPTKSFEESFTRV